MNRRLFFRSLLGMAASVIAVALPRVAKAAPEQWSGRLIHVSMRAIDFNKNNGPSYLECYAKDSGILARSLEEMKERMATYINTGKKE